MDIQQLLQLENDLAFQQLNRQINSFNPFKVLKLENYEIRHSNFIAWLLNPRENHGLRDIFMQKILEHVLLHEDNIEHPRTDDIIHLLNHSFIDSHVYRELKTDKGRYIDIVIMNQQQRFAIIIENKYYSSESEDQLNDYLHFMEHCVEGFTIIPIFLTIAGEKPSNEQYFTLSYEQIERILNSILILFEDQLHKEQYTFIQYYQRILQERYNVNPDYVEQAIAVYQQFGDTINALFTSISHVDKPLHFSTGFAYEFQAKYKDTISFIYNQGKNIMNYSFEKFTQRHRDALSLVNASPSKPSFLPIQWQQIEHYELKHQKYWLGLGLVVWFEKKADNRLRIKAELGPIESDARIALLTMFENNDLPIKQHSKLETSIYTTLYTNKIDIQQWNDIEEITEAMTELYNDDAFIVVRDKVAAALQGKHYVNADTSPSDKPQASIEATVKQAFEQWMAQHNIPSTNYRTSKRNLSFKLPLFDDYKEIFGATHENWWWDNGPLLCWLEIRPDLHRLKFVLEVGPIDTPKRIAFLQALQEKGITFNKKGLTAEAKFTRIYSKSFPLHEQTKEQLLEMLQTIDADKQFHNTLKTLEEIYPTFAQLYI